MLDATLASLILGDISQAHLPASVLVDVCEGDLRDEILGLASLADNTVEFVDLLEGETLGFVDHEVHKGNADEAESGPDEEDLAL